MTEMPLHLKKPAIIYIMMTSTPKKKRKAQTHLASLKRRILRQRTVRLMLIASSWSLSPTAITVATITYEQTPKTLSVFISRLVWVFSLFAAVPSTRLYQMLSALINQTSIRSALWKTPMRDRWYQRKLMGRRETPMAKLKMVQSTRAVLFWSLGRRWSSSVTTMSTTLIMNYRRVTTMMTKQRSRRT